LTFPLTVHPSGRWCKRIRNRLHYFGYWRNADGSIKPDGGDWKTGLELYKSQADDLHAGRTPRTDPDAIDLADLVDRFLTSKRLLLDNDELSPRTFSDYYRCCERIIAVFGKRQLLSDLRPEDFGKLRAELAKIRNPVGLANEIGRIRVVFNFAWDSCLIDIPIRYGQDFKKPSKKTLRKHRASTGKRMFDADEIRRLIDKASQPLKAMLLLGINGGLGQSDIANLSKSAVDLDGGWLDYPRPKTGVERRIPLWPDTVRTLREAIEERPKPRDKADADCVFITKYGRRWVRMSRHEAPQNRAAIDAVAQEMRKLMRNLKLKSGRGFYALRHTFRTIADQSKDQPAIDHIMGHARGDMASVYREGIDDDRLQTVVATVYEWLWPTKQEASDK
jgi:integrase